MGRTSACSDVCRSSSAADNSFCPRYQGRQRHKKYKVSYEFSHEVESRKSGADDVLVLAYKPMYGDVPGYKAGSPLGDDVLITLTNEGGEWRVISGAF